MKAYNICIQLDTIVYLGNLANNPEDAKKKAVEHIKKVLALDDDDYVKVLDVEESADGL